MIIRETAWDRRPLIFGKTQVPGSPAVQIDRSFLTCYNDLLKREAELKDDGTEERKTADRCVTPIRFCTGIIPIPT